MSEQTNGQNPPRVEFKVHFQTGRRGRIHLRKVARSKESECSSKDLPRLTRLLALAHRWNRLIEEGSVSNHTEIAWLMGLSRARVCQIMGLLYLAPEIQEAILTSPNETTNNLIPERSIRKVTRHVFWDRQLGEWKRLSLIRATKHK